MKIGKILKLAIFAIPFFFAVQANALEGCNQPHQLPLLTHWVNNIGFVMNGTDVKNDIYNPAVEQYYASGQPAPLYNNFFPSVNNYLAGNWDPESFTNEQVTAVMTKACNDTGVPFRLIQPQAFFDSRNDLLRYAQQGQPFAQVIHSNPTFGNQYLFTFIFPPNWNPARHYPLLMNSFYGLNTNMFTQEGPIMMNVIGKLYQENGLGAIGILWNGGGAIDTYSMNDKIYQDLNTVMSAIIPVTGIDPERVILFGGSRGSIAALNMASHPAIKSFKARYVYARNPASNISLVMGLTGSTYQDLMYARGWVTGYADSWRNDFLYPTSPLGLGGLNGQQANLAILTGTTDPAIIQQHFSLDGPEKTTALRERGTEVFLDLTSHDAIVPFVDKYRTWQLFKKLGIPVEARITYLLGHNVDAPDKPAMLLSVARKLSAEILYNAQKVPLVNAGHVTPYLLEKSGTYPVLFNASINVGLLPLALELPRFMNENTNSFLTATGSPWKMYRLTFFRSDGHYSLVEFQLDADGTWIWNPGPNLMASRYELIKTEEINARGQVLHEIQTLRSSLPMENNVIVDVTHGDISQYGVFISNFLSSELYGPNNEFRLRYGDGTPLGNNNGIVEIPEQQASVRPPIFG